MFGCKKQLAELQSKLNDLAADIAEPDRQLLKQIREICQNGLSYGACSSRLFVIKDLVNEWESKLPGEEEND